MKKLFLFLLILTCISFSTSAYDYELKNFETEEGNRIYHADSENLIIGNVSRVKLYDINGNSLMDEWYNRIYPYDLEFSAYRALDTEYYHKYSEGGSDYINHLRNNGFRCYEDDKLYEEAYDFLTNKKIEITNENSISVEIRDIYDSKGNRLYKEYGKDYSDEDRKTEYEKKKLLVFCDDDINYAVYNNEGKPLTGYVYDSFSLSDVSPGIFELKNKEETFIGNYNTGEWAKVDRIKHYTYEHEVGLGFVEETKNGKYVYYNNHLKKVIDTEFDEFIGVYNNSAVFRHSGKYYAFDTEWNFAYEGEKEIKAVYFGNYVIENENGLLGLYDENFNVIIPPEYKNIYRICNNVYIADDVLYSQGRIVTSDLECDIGENGFAEKGTCISAYDKINNRHCIIDVEGNELISSDSVHFVTNGFDVFCENGKGTIGRVIFKDTNPNVRINGKLLVSDTMARIKNNITLVPLRALAEKTGFDVSYNEETKEIKISKEDKEIKFTLGKKKCYSNDAEISLDAAPEVINNRTLVPVRAISDAFGYDISWDEERRLVEINTSADTTANSD